MKRIRPISLGLLLAISAIVFVNCTENASAAVTLYVGGTGVPNYPTIGEALNVAADGDTIIVSYDTYLEQLLISKSVTIRGDPNSPARPILRYSTGSAPILDIKTKDVRLEHLEIDGIGTNNIEAGIRSDVSGNEHYNVDLIDLDVHGVNQGYGIKIFRTNPNLAYPSDHVIQDCLVHDNGNGILIESDPNPILNGIGHYIWETEVYDNFNDEMTSGYGIYVCGDRSDIRNSRVHDNYYGVFLDDADSTDITRNSWEGPEYGMEIHDNIVGLWFDSSDHCTVSGTGQGMLVEVFDNGLTSGEYLWLYGSSENTFEHANMSDNRGKVLVNHVLPDVCDGNRFTHCIIRDNADTAGRNYIYIDGGVATRIDNSTVLRTTGASSRIDLKYSPSTVIADNDFGGTGMNVTAEECPYCFINGNDLLRIDLIDCDHTNVSGCSIRPGYYAAPGHPYSECVYMEFCHEVMIYDVSMDTADYGIVIYDCHQPWIIGGPTYPTIRNVGVMLDAVKGSRITWKYYDVQDGNEGGIDIDLDDQSSGNYSRIINYEDLEVVAPLSWNEYGT